jgi:hypothetical protein
VRSSIGGEIMNFKSFSKYSVPVLLGIVAFLLITGGKIIRPTYTNWLMEGDSAQHYLGWQFFRQAPIVQWPIGANKNFGMEIGSSVVYTDSIPLLAFTFKPFKNVLPDKFQYFGIWILICFICQSIFAWKLLNLFTQDRLLILLGSALFAVAPTFLWRLNVHQSLCGQWIILAGIYFYLSSKFSLVRWIILTGFAALIHAYFIVMVGFIFIADLVQRSWQKELSIRKSAIYFLCVCAGTVMIMWAAGYFMLSGGIVSPAGLYRMNLLAIIDSNDWSKVIQDQSQGVGDYCESFNYLGIGVILLGLIAMYEYFREPQFRLNCRKFLPLAAVSAILTLYSISNQVAIGGNEIFQYKWPQIFNAIVGAFRSEGRFFWPVYYLIYLTIIRFVILRTSLKRMRLLLVGLVLFHVFDSSDVYHGLRNTLYFAPGWTSPFHSEAWKNILSKYSKLIVVPPSSAPDNWIALSSFAAANKMTINTGYFARIDPAQLKAATQKLTDSVTQGKYDVDSLYVFNDENLWKIANDNVSPEDFIGTLDGFKILAPKASNQLNRTLPGY